MNAEPIIAAPSMKYAAPDLTLRAFVDFESLSSSVSFGFLRVSDHQYAGLSLRALAYMKSPSWLVG